MDGMHRTGRAVTDASNVILGAELGCRQQAALCNTLTRLDRYSLSTFESSAAGTPGALWWDWPGDQIGRWLSLLRVAQGCGWTPAPGNRAAVADRVLPRQSAGGNFGPPADPAARQAQLISGNAFALRGLMDAFADTREPRYLEAARRLGRYFEAAFDAWKGGDDGPVHEFYGHCLDGLVRLHELGADAWALALARRIGDRAGRTKHTHHSLSLYRGMIDLHRATGAAGYLAATEDYLAWCRASRIVTGGLPEVMPESHQDEGCGLADYVIVNCMMFAATGRDLYLDEAENTLVNHLAMNQFHTGGFGHRAFAQDIVGGKDWQGWDGRFGSENPGCCSLWGAWALGQLGRYVVTRDGDAVEVNSYPCASVSLPGLGIDLAIRSDYPRMRAATITIHCAGRRSFALRLRLPNGAAGASVAIDGRPVDVESVGRRVVVHRKWTSCRLEIVFPMTTHLVPWPTAGSDQVAAFDGPQCLGLYDTDGDLAAYHRIALADDRAVAIDARGAPGATLRPIADDWQSPDVAAPHRMRVLFGT